MARNKPRAWANMKGVLPDAPVESDRELAINAAVDERKDKTMKELADEYNLLALEEEAAKAREKAISILYEAIERQMNRYLDSQSTDIWRDPSSGFSFWPKYDIYPSVEDKSKLMQHLRDTNQTDKLILPHPTLRSDCAEALGPTGSGVVPPGVKVYLKTSISRRKA